MIRLPESSKAWGSTEFDDTFRNEVGALDINKLPLQQCLAQSSYVSESRINVVILNTSETADAILVKTGIFYAGVIAGSCCADDPTPQDEQTEYCEIQLEISKSTAETQISLVTDNI